MAITDINISEELVTNAPSIKYRGEEGPKSPEEEMMMVDAMLKEEYEKYVYDLLEIRPEATPMSFEEFRQMTLAEGQMSGGQPLPQDPTKPINPFAPKPTGPVLPDRQMAAFGGIMGVDGRRRYGIGSKLKKFVRKVIPNEVADIAVKAAPFVAPFNPLAAGLMSGLGSFDQTGKIGSSLKSGLINYGLGQGARYLGGAEFQRGINPFAGDNFGFSRPVGDGGIKNLFKDKVSAPIKTSDGTYKMSTFDKSFAPSNETGNKLFSDNLSTLIETAPGEAPVTLEQMVNFNKIPVKNLGQPAGILKTIKDFALDNKLLTGIAAGTLGAAALMGNMEPDELQDLQRGEGLDIKGIRAEIQEAFKDPTGEKLAALRSKYPFLGRRDTKNLSQFAMGGRIRRAEGGLMDLGGMEKDYRAEGGFVPIGREEKADDVPARLSVNEFVFTADAVRNAGGGDIDKGAEVMENMMKHLEQGGQVSDESQGMAGAQQMFETSERLSEVI
jgi:uncharacterized short protein YbdD (DUF466 family)